MELRAAFQTLAGKRVLLNSSQANWRTKKPTKLGRINLSLKTQIKLNLGSAQPIISTRVSNLLQKASTSIMKTGSLNVRHSSIANNY